MSTKGSWAETVSVETLEACAESINAKIREAARTGDLPADWAAFTKSCSKCEAFKELLHQHAHSVIEATQQTEMSSCKVLASAMAAAVAWGLEIAQAMSETNELNKLLVN